MPSTHSTALTFFYAYLAPIYLQWSVPLTVAWVMGLWSRRELGYHTFAQIAAGAAIGAVAALTWHQIWLHNVDVIQAYWSLIIKYIQL
jgi:dolichyldiphosphatase